MYVVEEQTEIFDVVIQKVKQISEWKAVEQVSVNIKIWFVAERKKRGEGVVLGEEKEWEQYREGEWERVDSMILILHIMDDDEYKK